NRQDLGPVGVHHQSQRLFCLGKITKADKRSVFKESAQLGHVMFSHLKAEDFVNLMEGLEVPSKVRRHLDTCARCRGTWESTQSVHSDMTSLETDVPEPDWDHFRSSVRDQLLSRSIQRESTVRRWTGWSIRPATVWAFSLFLAVGVTTVTVLWELNYPA